MQLSKQELDVGLATRDVKAAAAFYRDVLGFKEQSGVSMGDVGTMAPMRVGAHTIKLYDFARPPEQVEGGTDKANGMRLLAFILDDLDAVLARYDAAGLRYSRLPVPESAKFKLAFASDADGNALELVGLRAPAGDRLTTRMQIGLTVADVQRSRRFYGEQLGLKEEPEMKLPASMGTVGNVRYGFVLGGTTIKFWSRGELPTKTGAPPRYTGIRLITAHVPDADAAHAELVDRGITVAVAPHDFQGLARVFFVTDPDGNWIEFASPLRK